MSKNAKKTPYSFFLHCDECHHEVDFEGKMSREHVGFCCPVCDSDMLTERDFKVGMRIQRMIIFLQWIGLMKPANRNTTLAEGEKLLRTHHHNGVTTVREL